MRNHRWPVILAGGHGTRLQSLTRRITGDERPKQFCCLLGDGTLLGQTRARLASVAPADQATFVLLRAHERYFRAELTDVHPSRLFVQPFNQGTTAAIAFSLLRLLQLDRQAVVGFFPADHHCVDDGHFAAVIDLAYEEAQTHRDRLILVGAQPDHAEVEYGWIEPGRSLNPARAIHSVARFVEKPPLAVAQQLFQQDCLWNTFVVVGRLEAFLGILGWTVPEVLETLSAVTRPNYNSGWLELLYSALPVGDFSHQVLSVATDRLAVLRMAAGWTDLGTPNRLFAALRKARDVVRLGPHVRAHANYCS